MIKYTNRVVVVFSAAIALSGCMATNPVANAVSGFQSALTETTGPLPVTITAITLKVPNDPGIQTRKPAAYTTVIARDIGFDSRTATVMTDAIYNRLVNESLTPNSFVVHARTDNGTAGSGIKYGINFAIHESPSGYEVKLAPVSRSTYQTGLVGKFPLPPFSEVELRNYLTSLQLVYRFELDSPYSSESLMSNFTRLAKPRAHERGWVDPVTGKIYGRYFVSEIRGKSFPYTIEVYPYRNGSKAVVSATVPGVETSPQTVDFAVLISEIRRMLEAISNS